MSEHGPRDLWRHHFGSSELGRIGRAARFLTQLSSHCARRLKRNNAMAMASSLSFRTIFAIVPALLLAMLVLKAVGQVDQAKLYLREFLAKGGFTTIQYSIQAQGPATTQTEAERITVADQIEAMVEKVEQKLSAGGVGSVGVGLLIFAAIGLLVNVEVALNRIYEAPRQRPWLWRFVMYWTLLTLGPIVLSVVVALGYGADKAMESFPLWATLVRWTGWSLAVVTGATLLVMVYAYMPSVSISLRSALVGAIIVVPTWLIAKWAFRLYVEYVAKKSFYGAMGLVPLFLAWLQLSWYLFLFGAQLAYTVEHLARFQDATRAERIRLGPWDYLAATMAIGRPQMAGEGPVDLRRLSETLNMPGEIIDRLLTPLISHGIVSQVVGEGRHARFLLAKPPEKIEVIEILGLAVPDEQAEAILPETQEISQRVAQVRDRSEDRIRGLSVAAAMEGNLPKTERDQQ